MLEIDAVPVPLHFRTLGDPGAPPLIMLHGLFGSGNNWNRHARQLANRYRVILPDLRNHGQSPHDETMSYPAMAADLESLILRQGMEGAFILGHSMGGKVAMTLALAKPPRVSALIVADIAPIAYRHENRGLIDAMRCLPLGDVRSRSDADRLLSSAIPTLQVRQFLLTNLERDAQGYRWRIPLDILAKRVTDLEGWPALDDRDVYDSPALFVFGGESDYVDQQAVPIIRRHFPESRLTEIPDAAHWLHVDQPERFGAAVDDFLDALD